MCASVKIWKSPMMRLIESQWCAWVQWEKRWTSCSLQHAYDPSNGGRCGDVVSEMTPKARTRLLQTAFEASRPKTMRSIAISQGEWIDKWKLWRRMDLVERIFWNQYSGSYRKTRKCLLTALQRTIFGSIGDALYHASIAQDDILVVKAWLRRLSQWMDWRFTWASLRSQA